MSDKHLGGAPPIGLVVSILVLASATSIMSTDMYAPSLPDLADEFNTSASKIKLTISLNMVAFGLAQLLHGPLSDRFGRRPILLWSLAGVVVGCLLCTSAQTVNQLILARIFLGLVAAAEAVIGLAILKDLYVEKQQVKALALLANRNGLRWAFKKCRLSIPHLGVGCGFGAHFCLCDCSAFRTDYVLWSAGSALWLLSSGYCGQFFYRERNGIATGGSLGA